MDIEQIKERLTPLILKHKLPLGLALLGLIFFGYGLISLSASSSTSNDIIFESGGEAGNDEISEKKAKIAVDVEGGVVKPGVYELSDNSRMKDVLIIAGGLSDQADRGWVAKNFNLAAKVKDGMKVYIPMIGEVKGTSTSTTPLRQSFEGQAGININTASEKELDSLPGIGSVTAGKIINARPYNSIEELLEKKVVSNKVFEEIKEKITAY